MKSNISNLLAKVSTYPFLLLILISNIGCGGNGQSAGPFPEEAYAPMPADNTDYLCHSIGRINSHSYEQFIRESYVSSGKGTWNRDENLKLNAARAVELAESHLKLQFEIDSSLDFKGISLERFETFNSGPQAYAYCVVFEKNARIYVGLDGTIFPIIKR